MNDAITHASASLKPHFARALAAGGERLHLAAHSHHLWPDVSHAAQAEAWSDAASLWDTKWSRVMGTVLPEARAHLAHHLNLPDPATIALAPTTHDFLLRLLSSLDPRRTPRVLATDGEFHSFARQIARLAEDGLVEAELVPVEPFATFADRFAARAASGAHDLVWVSQVFFNSGFAIDDLTPIVRAVPRHDALVVIDGYHGLLARPTDLAAIADRAFYLGGGYKYVMAGEGACFMHCPPGRAMRPRATGWFAGFSSLNTARTGEVPYADDGTRFMGATLEPTPFYRLNAAMRLVNELGLDAGAIHARARAMQRAVAPRLDAAGIDGLRLADLMVPWDTPSRGNFLAYRSPRSAAIHAALMAAGIVTDVRADIVRLGFGLYHDPEDAPVITDRIVRALAG